MESESFSTQNCKLQHLPRHLFFFFFFNQGIVKQPSLNNRDATRDLNITIKLQFSNKKKQSINLTTPLAISETPNSLNPTHSRPKPILPGILSLGVWAAQASQEFRLHWASPGRECQSQGEVRKCAPVQPGGSASCKVQPTQGPGGLAFLG